MKYTLDKIKKEIKGDSINVNRTTFLLFNILEELKSFRKESKEEEKK